MNNELNDQLLLLAPKEEVDLEEYLQLKIYLTWNLPRDLINYDYLKVLADQEDKVQAFIDLYFVDLPYSTRNIRGVWKGIHETSTLISHIVLASEAFPIYNRFKEIAQKYKEEFNQECVLLTVTPIKAKFV